jgi:hypothetical protein
MEGGLGTFSIRKRNIFRKEGCPPYNIKKIILLYIGKHCNKLRCFLILFLENSCKENKSVLKFIGCAKEEYNSVLM